MKIKMSKSKEFYIKIIIILFIILMTVLIFIKFRKDNNPDTIIREQKNALFEGVEKSTNAKITKFATYGTHLNLEGNIDIIKLSGIKIDYVDVIVKKLNGEEYNIKANFNCSDNVCSFSTFDEINTGIDLEKLSIDTYYLLAKVTFSNGDAKYYSLINNSEYSDITYYTITKNNTNNKINISFDTYNDMKYMEISVENSPKLPDDVYDVAIDPSKGGREKGATSGEYTEADLVLDYGLKLKSELENLGLKVYISRDEDYSDTEDTANNMYSENGRINLLNASHAKILISLQINGASYDQKNGGIEIYAPSNCNLDFASKIAENVVKQSGGEYSQNTRSKKMDGVYVRNFTNSDILAFKSNAIRNKYEPYNITLTTPYLYIIRETGGIATNAFVDGRNSKYGTNKYYNSNTGIETYLVNLGYMSIEKDLNNIVNNEKGYINGILDSIKYYCNL